MYPLICKGRERKFRDKSLQITLCLANETHSINPMIGVFCIVLCIVCVPYTDPNPGTSFSRRFARFDYVGSILITASITSLIMAINFGGTLFAWNSGRTIALFIVGGVLAITFAIQQTLCIFTHVDDRVFPIQFLNNKNAVLLFICAAASNTACFARKSPSSQLYDLTLNSPKQSIISQFICK